MDSESTMKKNDPNITAIEFRNVDFSYEDKKVLDNLSFDLGTSSAKQRVLSRRHHSFQRRNEVPLDVSFLFADAIGSSGRDSFDGQRRIYCSRGCED